MTSRRKQPIEKTRPVQPHDSGWTNAPVEQTSDGSSATPVAGHGHQFSSLSIVPPALELRRHPVQPGPTSELDADWAADRVTRTDAPATVDADRRDDLTFEHPPPELSKPLVKPSLRSAAATMSGGAPLDPSTRAYMEPRFGADFSDVRIHVDPAAAASVHALAFTRGSDIVFGQNQYAPNDTGGRRLLAHELAHVSQDAPPNTIQRQHAPAPVPPPREGVVNRSEVGERSRTVAKIEVVGHASPRWRGARTPKIADENNWRLAEERADRTRIEIERLLASQLPGRQLVFDYQFKRASKAGPDGPVKALDEPADVTLEAEGRGSSDTLVEAGARGRQANDDPMRRVDVKVILHSATETDVQSDIERTERKPGATTDWSIWVTGEAGVEALGKASAILIQLKNEKTGVIGTYAGWTGGAGVSIGINIAKTSLPDFESFTTPEPMSFADFSGANFTIGSIGFGVGAFGAEWSKFRFARFPGGQKTPDGIQVGGISFGGIELNLGSAVYGAMFLTDSPSETFDETSRTTRVDTFESLSEEGTAHRVLFDTGSPDVTAWESDQLNEYLFAIVARSGF